MSRGWPTELSWCRVPHTTAGITVNENADPDVVTDVLHGLARLFPRDAGWRHVEGNSDAHLKTALVGNSGVLPVRGGRLALGTWQAVYFAEFDGPRSRRVDVTVVPGVRLSRASRGVQTRLARRSKRPCREARTLP